MLNVRFLRAQRGLSERPVAYREGQGEDVSWGVAGRLNTVGTPETVARASQGNAELPGSQGETGCKRIARKSGRKRSGAGR